MADEPPDPVADALRAAPLTQQQRHDLWDAYQQAPDEDALTTALQAAKAPNSVAHQLWDLKHAEGAQRVPVPMTFAVVNKQPVTPEEPTPLALAGEAVKGAAETLNPLPLLHDVYQHWDPTRDLQSNVGLAAARLGVNIARASWGQVQQAVAKYGDYQRTGDWKDLSEAIGHAGGAFPLIGPAVAQAGTLIGTGDPRQMARGAGQAAALLAPSGVSAAREAGLTPGWQLPVVPKVVSPNPVERAAVQWGLEQGLPVDVATATGSPVVRGVQTVVSKLPGGAGVARAAGQQMAEALETKGRGLAQAVAPGPEVTPYQAGAAIAPGIEAQMRQLQGQAGQEYRTLEAAEQLPEHQTEVPRPYTPEELAQQAAAKAKLAPLQENSLGAVPTDAELTELRRIHAELDTFPFVKRTWTEAPGKTGNAAGGDYDITAGAAGAAVYNDILAELGRKSGTGPARLAVQNAIARALDSGHYTAPAKAAYRVAQARLTGEPGLSAPWLPAGAGSAPAPTQSMGLAVDLGPFKRATDPAFGQLQAAREVMMLRPDTARAYNALEDIRNGPDVVPLSVAREAASALGPLTGANVPIRSRAQGIMAKAYGALQDTIAARAAEAGPDIQSALETGRATWKAAKGAEELLGRVRDEPVQAFRIATAPRDTQVNLLEAIRDHAPEVPAQIGRAWLEQSLERATVEGGWEHQRRLLRDWNELGPKTKAMLFPDPDVRAGLNNFMNLQARYNVNPNVSGSALVGTQVLALTHPLAMLKAVMPTRLLARLLYNPATSRLVTQGLSAPPGSVMRAALAAEVSKLAATPAANALLPAVAGSPPAPPGATAQQ